MRKIAIYLPSLEGGGAERITVILANALAERGYDLDFVVASAQGPYRGELSDAIRIIDLGKSRVAASLPGLAKYLRRNRPDILLSGMGHANLIAIIARRIARVNTRVFVTEHNSLLRGLDTAKGRTIKALMRFLYPLADRIVCVSRGIAKELSDLLDLPQEKLCTIYNPVDVDGIRQRAMDQPDHPWFAPGAPPVILGVGRLTEQKDFATLLRAFAEVRNTREARLVILGEGEKREELNRLAEMLGIKDDLLMPGFQTNPYGWMRASAIYAMSSAWEGLPGVLLEAMATGTPVISTNCKTGPEEILENGRWGRLVPVGDHSALAQGILSILNDSNHVDVAARIETFRTEHARRDYEKMFFNEGDMS